MAHEKTIWPGSTQLAPVPAVLVGCGDGKTFKYNLITVAWAGTVCSDPAMLAISVRPERFSFAPISQLKEFTVNLPPAHLAAELDRCGVVSGRDCDKFEVCHLTAVRGEKVAAPIVAECPVALECRVKNELFLGSHTLFLAEIVAVQVESALIDAKGKFDIDQADLVAYAHGHYYRLGDCIGHFGYSVRRKPGSIVRK